jgi:Uma2 family endonuclease
MTSTKLVTAEELERMPDDGFRYDLIAGVLIKQMPANFQHGALAATIAWILNNWVKPRRLGIVVGAETGFLLARNPDHVLGPDVAFVRADRLPAKRQWRHYLPLAPDLAVEVVSPSDSAQLVTDKVIDYLEHGVRLVWVVHPVRQTVTVWQPDRSSRTLSVVDELDGGDVLPGFRVAVAEIFED